MLEKSFETKLRKTITSRGGWVVKYLGCGMSSAGTPDLLCCINGYFVAIECKSSVGKPTELQKIKLNQILASGGVGIVASPKNYDDVIKLIDYLTLKDVMLITEITSLIKKINSVYF